MIADMREDGPLKLAVVLPTYNERDNIAETLHRLEVALTGVRWEAIVVDDDSPDGTANRVLALAGQDSRIRLIHRIGRRGLASACVEGMLATSAAAVAVMDADGQHDETILPRMLERLEREDLDLVVGTRNAEGGSMGSFCAGRVWLSSLGKRLSGAVCRCTLSDPMSGFFLVRRSFVLEVVHALQPCGFKILVDLLASSERPVRLAEVGYTFGERRHGESKLDVAVGVEYLSLLLSKRIGGALPLHLMLYLLVGALGLGLHLLTLFVLTHVAHLGFAPAQICATFAAMVENFWLNNRITYRDNRYRGLGVLAGGARFILACSFGAWANIIFAHALLSSGVEWYAAGFAGIVLGSVWNLSISSLFTWKIRRNPAPEPIASRERVADGFEGSR